MKTDPHALYFASRIAFLKRQIEKPEIDSDPLRRKPYLAELRAIVFHLASIRGKDRIVSSITVRFVKGKA